MPARHCFTYGTLMCADIMAAVCGHAVRGEAATLRGYARHPVRDERYPGIRPDPRASVFGVVYRALGAEALARLDAFEGAQYQRRPVGVRLGNGEDIAAETYVFHPGLHHLLLPGDWCYEAFLNTGKAEFMHRYLGFFRL